MENLTLSELEIGLQNETLNIARRIAAILTTALNSGRPARMGA